MSTVLLVLFRYNGEQVWRRVGPAWLEPEPDAGADRGRRSRPRRGRVQPGYFDERAAHVRPLIWSSSEHPTDIAVVALGATPNSEWLADAGLAHLDGSLATDETLTTTMDDRILAAGDIATFPHHLLAHEPVRIEHWANAVEQGTLAGRNALRGLANRVPLLTVPTFWSDQYEHRIQSTGFPARAEEIEIVDGAISEDRFVAAGYADGILISAVCVNRPARLRHYRRAVVDARSQAASV